MDLFGLAANVHGPAGSLRVTNRTGAGRVICATPRADRAAAHVLLALIVEKVSGRSFAQFLKKNIFATLGMAGTVA